MKCPKCGQSVPEIATRCPNCQASTDAGFGGVMPPRASQRDVSTSLSLRLSQFVRAVGRLFSAGPAADMSLANRLERLFASPELWLSLAVPGAGQYYLGRVLVGVALFAVTAALLAGLLILALDEYSDITIPLACVGIFLGIVHMHAWSTGARLRNWAGRCMPQSTAVLVIMIGLGLQFSLLGWLLYGPIGHLGNHVYLHGNNLWGPVLIPGDRLVVHPVSSSGIRPGDLVMISNTLCERVLGIASDTVAIEGNGIIRNGTPVIGTYSMPLSPVGSHYMPDWAWRSPPEVTTSVVVPANNIAYLWWGRTLKTVPVADIRGRIDGIAAPAHRRCRFENGKPVPLPRRSFLSLFTGY
ncbi:MAG TPA: hypothetical protein PLU72_13035 [Candidatus Ozemobacteraceae bacterium]|nr:hypothetical protein [Candidatus Ozemobacteraceae bacterium]HQG30055.1 hypothetical protein [Candidatus Ozemobacteraceae bacterium]